ncbi:nitrilase-related carbon-nitrogen hydrolase [Trinickia acidisoli]|uniref:nitrilase-related carbon-nitrogen hydrolase n=1 Tax=Trinickia acidisoli TaxID=2767482 RepID=UPI001A8F99AC|nr:nitrilase-related carbon-nitrogen hydrolase [Trinickia acidisoli]
MSRIIVPPLRVAALPFASFCASADGRSNGLQYGVIAERLADAARDGVGLAVFPEMSLCGVASMERLRRSELEALSEPADGLSIGAVAQAAEVTGVAAGVGWLERARDGALYNSYVVCMPDGTRHVHRKVYTMGSAHLRSGECFDVFDTPWGITMSILIGADNYLPENARVAALKGATLLVAPHRSGLGTGVGAGASPCPDWFAHALPARAGENGMFVVLSDAQAEPKGQWGPGVALIADPGGAVIAESKAPHCPVATAVIDPKLARQSIARHWLAARRPELYASLIAPESEVRGDARPWAVPQREASARGSVAVSFAIVRRRRPLR